MSLKFQFQQWATENQERLGGQYTAVFNGAENSRESIRWAEEVQNDFMNYFDSDEIPATTSTAAPIITTPVVTEVAQNIQEPNTPALAERTTVTPTTTTEAPTTTEEPSAAVATYVSGLVMAFAVMANFIL